MLSTQKTLLYLNLNFCQAICVIDRVDKIGTTQNRGTKYGNNFCICDFTTQC